jgi:hypothetical protein
MANAEKPAILSRREDRGLLLEALRALHVANGARVHQRAASCILENRAAHMARGSFPRRCFEDVASRAGAEILLFGRAGHGNEGMNRSAVSADRTVRKAIALDDTDKTASVADLDVDVLGETRREIRAPAKLNVGVADLLHVRDKGVNEVFTAHGAELLPLLILAIDGGQRPRGDLVSSFVSVNSIGGVHHGGCTLPVSRSAVYKNQQGIFRNRHKRS